jgi:hypothetical protein
VEAHRVSRERFGAASGTNTRYQLMSIDANIAATFTEPLLCVNCGNEGRGTWEQGNLVRTSERFYLRMRLPLGSDPDVACLTCGSILRECRYFKPRG